MTIDLLCKIRTKCPILPSLLNKIEFFFFLAVSWLLAALRDLSPFFPHFCSRPPSPRRVSRADGCCRRQHEAQHIKSCTHSPPASQWGEKDMCNTQTIAAMQRCPHFGTPAGDPLFICFFSPVSAVPSQLALWFSVRWSWLMLLCHSHIQATNWVESIAKRKSGEEKLTAGELTSTAYNSVIGCHCLLIRFQTAYNGRQQSQKILYSHCIVFFA